MSTKKLSTIQHRHKKQAKTKLALLAALVDKLATGERYDSVRIRDLCVAADISEASFFNYFPAKEALLVYFIQIWSLEVGWHARQVLAQEDPLGAVEEIFVRTADMVEKNPHIMAEIIAFQARCSGEIEPADVSIAERLLAHPDLPGVEELPARGLDAILPELLAEAKRSGQIPAEVDEQFVYVTLLSIFFGAPVALRRCGPETLGAMWKAQLAFIWRSIGAKQPDRMKTARQGKKYARQHQHS
ncbi:MAG TPA: TetR/AcrR family transcriptional regulator [Geobacteraceae bacterium]